MGGQKPNLHSYRISVLLRARERSVKGILNKSHYLRGHISAGRTGSFWNDLVGLNVKYIYVYYNEIMGWYSVSSDNLPTLHK